MVHRLSLLLLLLCSAIVAPATLTVYDMKGWGILRDMVVNADGFVKVYYNNEIIGTTEVKYNTDKPVWEESFSYGNANYGNMLRIRVYDKVNMDDELLGFCVNTIVFGDHQQNCDLILGGQLQYRYSLQ